MSVWEFPNYVGPIHSAGQTQKSKYSNIFINFDSFTNLFYLWPWPITCVIWPQPVCYVTLKYILRLSPWSTYCVVGTCPTYYFVLWPWPLVLRDLELNGVYHTFDLPIVCRDLDVILGSRNLDLDVRSNLTYLSCTKTLLYLSFTVALTQFSCAVTFTYLLIYSDIFLY